MLGSIQKYRPARKPEPYNRNQILNLQGIRSSDKSTTPTRKGFTASQKKNIKSLAQDSVFKDNSYIEKLQLSSINNETTNRRDSFPASKYYDAQIPPTAMPPESGVINEEED